MLSQEVNDFEKSTLQYFSEIGDINPLSKEEERKLLKEYQTTHSEEAKNKILRANLKFVISIAKSYKNRGLAFADLVAEGNMGLIKALDKFDMNHDVKFFTYAVWWIKQKIEEAISKRNNLLAEELPNDHEDNSEVKDTIESDTDTLEDGFINDETGTALQRELEIKDTLNILFEPLTEREKDILIDYYGINGSKPKTLEEIGKKFKLTKERVRQINEISLKKMRGAALNKCITKDIYR